MHVGPDELREWMRRRQVNQREAAELLGITEVFLSQLLNYKRQPGLANAVKIERLTGIPIESWLLTEVSNEDEPEAVAAPKHDSAKR